MAEHGGRRTGAGRPGGSRAKLAALEKASLRELARAHTKTAIAALASIARGGKSEAARIAAATALLDRGYGRPAAMSDATDDTPPPSRNVSSDLELARAIAFILAKAGAQGGAP